MQGQSDAFFFFFKTKTVSLHLKREARPISFSQQGLGLGSSGCLVQQIHMVSSQYSGQYILHIQRVRHSFCYEAHTLLSPMMSIKDAQCWIFCYMS